MSKHAIVIGIETYMDAQIQRVPYADTDAQAFSELLAKHGFDLADQLVLLNEAATKNVVMFRVKNFLRNVQEEDFLYVFYAGHGLAVNDRNYVTCYDSVAGDLAETGIELQTLLRECAKSTCKHIVLFLDCCHSGVAIDGSARGVLSQLKASELEDFIAASEFRLVFSACKANETSHSHASIKHGLWTYHLLEALKGNAPDAREEGSLITAASLQSYLAVAMPKTWRTLFNSRCSQTPWLLSAAATAAVIADVGPLLAEKARSSQPFPRLKDIIFTKEETGRVATLSGFKKRSHFVPTDTTNSSRDFVRSICRQELQDHIEQMHHALRDRMGYRRTDFEVRGPEEGSATIITPDFEYSVDLGQDEETPSEYVIEYTLRSIQGLDVLQREGFDEVFGDSFDTLVFEAEGALDPQAMIDAFESKPLDDVTIDYPADASRCTISLEGREITFGRRSITMVCSRTTSPALMLSQLVAARNQLEGRIAPQLPPSGTANVGPE